MIAMTVFRDDRFGEIRTIDEDGKVLFCGKDVAEALGYARPRDAISDHTKGAVKRRILTAGGVQEMSFITEGDVYRLIVSSKLPKAQEFETWVFDTVLPAIRKSGGYIAGEERMDDDQLMAQALLVASRKLEERSAQLRAANATIEELAPKAAYCDALAGGEGDTSFRETAKRFGVPEKRFIAVLMAKGYIYRDAHGTLMPFADHQKRGQFVVREVIDDTGGRRRVRSQTKITPTGRQVIWRMLAKEGMVGL